MPARRSRFARGSELLDSGDELLAAEVELRSKLVPEGSRLSHTRGDKFAVEARRSLAIPWVEGIEDQSNLEPFRSRRQSGSRSIAAPLPVARRLDHLSAHRVEHDVSRPFQQVRVLFNEVSLESPFEKWPGAALFMIEASRIVAVESLHASGKGRLERFDEQMVVIGHQRVRVNAPAEVALHAGGQCEKAKPVGVVEEDVPAIDSAVVDVPESAGLLKTKWSRQ